MNQLFKPVELARRDGPAPAREIKRGDHAPAHGLAMQQDFVARDLLNGVSHSVAEIQNHAQAVFALIVIHDAGFHADGCGNHFFERLRFAPAALHRHVPP